MNATFKNIKSGRLIMYNKNIKIFLISVEIRISQPKTGNGKVIIYI